MMRISRLCECLSSFGCDCKPVRQFTFRRLEGHSYSSSLPDLLYETAECPATSHKGLVEHQQTNRGLDRHER